DAHGRDDEARRAGGALARTDPVGGGRRGRGVDGPPWSGAAEERPARDPPHPATARAQEAAHATQIASARSEAAAELGGREPAREVGASGILLAGGERAPHRFVAAAAGPPRGAPRAGEPRRGPSWGPGGGE